VSAGTDSDAAERLFEAFERGEAIEPLTETLDGFDVGRAYAVQSQLVGLHGAAGRRVAGRKIGLTSLAMQRQLGVSEPDFGVVLDSHVFGSGARISRSQAAMIQPRVEAELAFVLADELPSGAGPADVLAATRGLVPALEIIDSRIADWRIGLPDTIADNASCFGIVLGAELPLPAGVDLATVGLVFSHEEETLATAAGAAVMGDPAAAVAWLARTLAGFGESLPVGEPILAGAFTAAVEAEPGRYLARFGDGIGAVEVTIDE
jgi:2-keto-4-pentenoate hydratase